MKVELISIGDEILIGQVVDTNSSWIAQRLIEIGIDVYQTKSISDKPEHIIEALNETKADLIIFTGGLGPTNDDLTKNTLCNYFETELVFNQKVYDHVQSLLVGRGVIVNDLNKEQAMLPKDALILENKSGTAAGMWFKKNGLQVISLPGVPFEMKGIVNNEIIPILNKKYNTTAIVYKTVMTQGLPESMLAMKIKDWEDNLHKSVKLAYLPRPGIVRLRLTAMGDNKDDLTKLVNNEIEQLINIIPQHIYGYDDIGIEKVVGELLKNNNFTLSTAESCTGGNISALITSVSGSSSYYKGSIISYSNEIKNNQLSVPLSVIDAVGVVSQEVVEIMSKSVLKKFNTDFSIAVSGIAGPEGGSEEKPVGTTWISVSSKYKTVSKQFLFGEHRGRNITRASLSALNMLRLLLLNKI